MEPNVGQTDRIIRIVAGLLLLSLTVVGPQSWWGLIGLVPLAILVVAAFTRFYRLAEPPGVNFDESHFIRFSNQYTARTCELVRPA